jgi:DNA-binding MarR family transcriptional regulator
MFHEINKLFYENIKNETKMIGINPTYRFIFMVLSQNKDGLTQSEICDLVHLKKSSVSELLHQMESEELIIREKSLLDNRKTIVKLTNKGKSLDNKIKGVFKKYELIMSSSLSNEEKENLISYIDRLKNALKGGIENDKTNI